MFFLYVLEMLNEIHTEELKILKKSFEKKAFCFVGNNRNIYLKKTLVL
jgi:hypothetical protein